MNHHQPNHYPAPPRLLLGVTLLAWGGLNNHALIALGIALLVEARYWLNWRWRFDLKGYSRAWILSLMALAGTVGFHSLNLTGPAALLAFLEWLPLIFLPLILAQQYGKAKAVPTTVFSVIARQRLKRERRLGKVIPESRIHLGYPYFAMTLLATAFPATGLKQQWQFFAVMVLLAGISLYFAMANRQRRLLPWLSLLVLIGGTSMVSSQGLFSLYFWVKSGDWFNKDNPEQPIEQNTAIGHLGELKLSRRIQWRAYTTNGQRPPNLLMTLGYNRYRFGKWEAKDSDFRDNERSFSDLLTTAVAKDKGEFAFETSGFEANETKATKNQYLRIRGSVDNNREPIPSPSAPILFSQAHEIDSIEGNNIGTLLGINAGSVIDLRIHTGSDPSLREAAPIQRIRNGQLYENTALSLPNHLPETKTLLSISAALGLDNLSDQEKIETLEDFFHDNFKYTTHLKIGNEPGASALQNFLETTREGHCEYFATATTLLLRASGVPAHYAVGYAVHEEGNQPGEYILRGTHAHAWCRAYLGGQKTIVEEEQTITSPAGQEKTILVQREVWTGGQWTNVDLTPPGWIAFDSPATTLKERIIDTFQRFREDFQIWRSSEKNRGWVNLALVIVAVALLAFVIWRLSGSRVHNESRKAKATTFPDTEPTGLNLLIPSLEKQFGAKPKGLLLTHWFQKILPEYSSTSRQRLFELHDSQRFGLQTMTASESNEFENLIQALEQTYTQRKDR